MNHKLIFNATIKPTYSRYINLVTNIANLEELEDCSTIEIEDKFITPIEIAPLLPIIERKKLKVINHSSYLNHMQFPECINDVEELRNYSVTNQTYLPCVKIALTESTKSNLINKLGTLYAELTKKSLGFDEAAVNGLLFIFGELLANIEEHSKAKFCYLFAQYYPKLEKFEFCLVDDGIGIFNSLKEAGREVKNDSEALYKVINEHLSAKKGLGEENRGHGIKNTRAMVIGSELKGDYLISSGSAIYLESYEETVSKKFGTLTKAKICGTMVAGRFNKPPENFSFYPYV
jgi:hypothetical protein